MMSRRFRDAERFFFGMALLAGLQALSSLMVAQAPTSGAPLVRAADIRKLPPEKAAQGLPIRVQGVVTAFSGYQNSFFVQDATAGISVDRTDHAEVHVGDRVQVVGVSGAGSFAPLVLASFVRVVGRAPQPRARRATLGDFTGGAQDSQRVEVQGTVHSARVAQIFHRDVLSIGLNLGGGAVTLLLQDFAGLDPDKLIDATIRVRGICSTGFNEKRQFVAVSLFVPTRAGLTIVQAARADRFAAPAKPIRTAVQFGQSNHQVKIAGNVTYQIPGRLLYLQDGEDGMRVQTSSQQVVPLGSRVEAVGFPGAGEYAAILEDGSFRVVEAPVRVVPRRIDAKDVIVSNPLFVSAYFDGQLVQVQGKIVESHVRGEERTWLLSEGTGVFGATLVSPKSAPFRDLSEGSVVRLVGVCSILTDSDRRPVSFQVFLRSPDDITIVHRASWWTPSHTFSLLGALGGGIVAVALWVVILRSRVERQTRMIRESESRFRNLAQRDVLTGLPNRLMLEDRIGQCLDRCRHDHRKAAILTIDIDRFKQINDTYGHPVGDLCLRIVAARLGAGVRESDTIARTGGEEFTFVVGGLDTSETAGAIVEGLLRLFHEPVAVLGQEIPLTVSIGAALYPDDGTEAEVLRKRSDHALYEAKRTGRNRAVFATKELWDSLEATASIEVAVGEALRCGSFVLTYQPIYDALGKIRRFEALLRSTDARLQQLGPSQYIPVAENSGLIIPLGRWIMEEACRQIREWQMMGMEQCPIAVNISARQLLHQNFADEVLETLHRFHLHPRLLELELTETAAMTELASVAEKVAQLARAGVTFSIDDFGTGYSSLARLRELPIKALKIDRSFVQSLEDNSETYTIILAIIQMAKSLKIQVVAEGVETELQFALLRELGCDFFQGYLFSRPLSAADVLPALVQNDAMPSAVHYLPLSPSAAMHSA